MPANPADVAPLHAPELREAAFPPFVLVPAPRVVGPGRREREYLRRVAHLEDLVAFERERQARLERELDASVRVERGAQRCLDRAEARLEASAGRERRLAALTGALQRDNELLRGRVLELERAVASLPAGDSPRRGFLARLFGAEPKPTRSARRRA